MNLKDMLGRPFGRRRSLSAPKTRLAVRRSLENLEGRHLLSGASSGATLVPRYGQIPLSFEANVGQTAEPVQFLSRGSGYTLFLTNDGATLSLLPPRAPGASPSQTAAGNVIQMQLSGASANPTLVGVGQQSGKSNYLIGNDPSQWHTDIPNFSRVEMSSVYPGVDLAYYGTQQQLEYDYIVAPGTDPGIIRMSFQGAQSQTIDGAGNLVLHTGGGDLVEQAPVLYQLIDGARQSVCGNYVVDANGHVGFSVGSYDASKPLVIDPTLSYSTFLGGSDDEDGSGIAFDPNGNAYITGYTASTDFPTQGELQPTSGSGTKSGIEGYDAFVTKINAAGTGIDYSTYIGGNDQDEAVGIAVDSDGNAYITGITRSTDFPTAHALQSTYAGTDDPQFFGGDAFVTKLNSTGSGLVFSTYLGAGGAETGFAIAVDANHDVYTVGRTDSVDFPVTSAAQSAVGGEGDAYAVKLKGDGSALIYSTYLGGSNDDQAIGVALDGQGDAFVTGNTSSNDFPVTTGSFQSIYNGGSDAFVTKLSPSGSSLSYSTLLGGGAYDQAAGIAVDADGNAYVVGNTFSSDFPTVGPIQPTLGGDEDAFVSKLNASGSALVYSTFLGGPGSDHGYGIGIDANRDAFVAGTTDWDSFPVVGAVQSSFGGNFDAFVAELDPAGSSLPFATYLGGTGYEDGNAIAVDGQGNVYVGGRTGSANFPTANALQPQLTGGEDAFVAKITLSHQAVQLGSSTAVVSSQNPSTAGQSVTFTATVTGAIGSPIAPTGTVTFMDGSTVLQVVSLVGAEASFTTSARPSALTISRESTAEMRRFSPARAIVPSL